MYKLLLVMAAAFAIGCGTVTVNLGTDVSDMGELVHDLDLTIEGPLVAMMADEDLEDVPGNCTASIDDDVLTFKCRDVTQAELDEEGEGSFDIQVAQTETDAGTEYRVTMPYPFEEEESDGSEDGFNLGVDPEDLVKMTFSWDVTVPGKIDRNRSNADSYDGSTALFETEWGEQRRDVFEVVSVVGAGGGCSAPY